MAVDGDTVVPGTARVAGPPGVFAERQPRSPRGPPPPLLCPASRGGGKLLGRAGLRISLATSAVTSSTPRRSTDSAPCGGGARPTVSRPMRAAFLGLRVGGRPPELPGGTGTARTGRRPAAVAHARCSRGVPCSTAATVEHAWPLGVPDRLAAPVRRLARSEVCRQLRTSNYRWGKPTIPPLWRLDSGGGADPLVAKARGVTRCRLLNSR